jgi:thioredoxin-related protein
MKKFKLTLLVVIATTLFVSAQETSSIKWYTLEEALELNAKQPKKIFIDVYTDWCGWCKTMDKNTFSNPYIAKYLSDNFYPVKFNAEGTKEITYKGQVFKNRNQGQRSAHDFAVALLQGKLSYPSVVFMDSTSTPITFLAGYLTPEQFEPIMIFISEDRYKTENWEVFQSKFVSKLPK